jgi:putative nucleotidyltransferase with HDIG domain
LKKARDFWQILCIGFGSFLISSFFVRFASPEFFGVNDLASRYAYSLSKKAAKPLKIIGIEVDTDSLTQLSQRYPLKRSVYARLLKVLQPEGINTLGFDFIFAGSSENQEDDLALEEALRDASYRVVLAYLINPSTGTPALPLPQLEKLSYATGMLNTPEDKDGLIRRLRGYVVLDEKRYYSFSVMLSAAILNQQPEKVISRLSLLKNKTYYINYLIKPTDIIRVSLFEAIYNLPALKEKYGRDFLKNSFVLVYPQPEISHDIYPTPLGRIPGGLLHINGVNTIVSNRLLRQVDNLSIFFLLATFLVLYYILKYAGFLNGCLFIAGHMIIVFWSGVLLLLAGMRFDSGRVIVFALIFFTLGSLYKYLDFLAQLFKIRVKATMDPLRNIFTLRYFYGRLELETKKIYFYREPFVVLLYFKPLAAAVENMDFQKLKELWLAINKSINLKGSLWAGYSAEEVAGCVITSPKKIDKLCRILTDNLNAEFSRRGIKLEVKLACLKFRKGYPVRELLFVLSAELKKAQVNDLIFFKEHELDYLLHTSYPGIKESQEALGGISEDIEEKNRQLLLLIDNLNKEHARTKEAFLETIASLAKALEARDPYTEGHSERVARYAVMLADELGWSPELKEKLAKAALLHDLGKIGIPDNILHKKEKLTEEEYNSIKKHGLISAKILEPLKDVRDILPWIAGHHEKWDGSGYPQGLAGSNISLGAQIIALADSFDAITTGRDYKKAFSIEDAIREITNGRGSQFNPQLADIFIKIICKLPHL